VLNEGISFLDWLAPFDRVSPTARAGQPLFCYQPAIDPAGDLLLWGRYPEVPDSAAGQEGNAGLILRWVSANGDVLV